LADITQPFVKKMSTTTLSASLTSIEETVFNEAWARFFYDTPRVVELIKSCPPDAVLAVLAAGERWGGNGWDTTKAAKTLRSLTGVALVTGQFKEYLSSFLYSIALTAGVDVPFLELSPKAADASFVLADLWQAHLEDESPLGAGAGDAQYHATEEDDEEDGEDGEQVGPAVGDP
jgi:hypothetical protein